jgi:hypothetical protein
LKTTEDIYVHDKEAQSIQKVIDALEALKMGIHPDNIGKSRLYTYQYRDGTLKFSCKYKV